VKLQKVQQTELNSEMLLNGIFKVAEIESVLLPTFSKFADSTGLYFPLNIKIPIFFIPRGNSSPGGQVCNYREDKIIFFVHKAQF
jgi:hypothetical protein